MTAQPARSKPATVTVEEAPGLPRTLGESITTPPSELPMPGVKARIVDLEKRIAERVLTLQKIHGGVSKAHHGPMVQDVADLMMLHVQDGNKVGESIKAVNEFWKKYFIDLAADPATAPETPKTKPHLLFKPKGGELGCVLCGANGDDLKGICGYAPNPFYRQFFRRWSDLSRWQAGRDFYRKVDEDGGERYPKDGVLIHGRSYMAPVDALLDEHTLSDVHQAFVNTIRPPKALDLTDLAALLEPAARRAGLAGNFSVVIRPKDLGKPMTGKGAPRRMRKPVTDSSSGIKGAVIGLLQHAHQRPRFWDEIAPSVKAFLDNPTSPALKAAEEEE